MTIALIYLLSAIAYLVIGGIVYFEDKKSAVKKLFFLICIDSFIWGMLNTGMNVSTDALEATKFRREETIFWSFLFPLLLHFSILLSGKGHWIEKWYQKGLLYLPAIFSVLLYRVFMPVPVMFIERNAFGWHFKPDAGKVGPLYDWYLLVFYILYASAAVILLLIRAKQTQLTRERKAYRLLSVGIIISMVLAGFLDLLQHYILEEPLPPFGIVSFLPAIGAAYYAIRKYYLMEFQPKSVIIDILKIMEEGLVLTDASDRILFANAGSTNMIARGGNANGLNFKDFLEYEEQPTDNMCDFLSRNAYIISPDGDRTPVILNKTVMRDEWNDILGIIYVYQDISIIKATQREMKSAYDNLTILVDERKKELTEANRHLEAEIEVRAKMEHIINQLAFYDSVTNLPNRTMLLNELSAALKSLEHERDNIAVLYVDIDGFKLINDALGHSKGELLLKMIGDAFREQFPDVMLVSRVAGDEFIFVMRILKDFTEVERMIERLRTLFKNGFAIGESTVSLTVSIGISFYPFDGMDADSLIKNADLAMYQAKQKGNNGYQFCSLEMKKEVEKDFLIRNDLITAVDRNEFELYYQPQVNSETGIIIGNEALIRWNHPELGLMGPGGFLDVAIKYDIMTDIDNWVLETACRQNKKWMDEGRLREPIAVNLSPKRFMDLAIVDKVKEVLEKTGLEPCYLELEITEGILLNNIEETIKVIRALKDLGIRIAIDDFGTEYSSLNYLKMLPVDRLKIAKSFVDGIRNNTVDEAIIDAIIVLTKKIGIDVIAEGVEEHDQMMYLRANECRIIQGYYYFKPMSVEMIEKQEIFEVNQFRRPKVAE